MSTLILKRILQRSSAFCDLFIVLYFLVSPLAKLKPGNVAMCHRMLPFGWKYDGIGNLV